MKTKGISLIELHVEKLVLLVAVVLFGGVAAWQFLSRPNQVDIPTHGQVDPGQVDRILREKAEAIQSRLVDSAPSEIDFNSIGVGLHSNDFERKLETGVGAELLAAASVRDPGQLVTGQGLILEGGLYHEPTFPAPQILSRVLQTADTLLDTEVARFSEQLEPLFPDSGEPHDITFATVAAVVDLQALRAELQSRKNGSQVPPPWYDDHVYMPDVVLEREERLADGTWGNRVTLDPLPGQRSYRVAMDEGAGPGFSTEVFEVLARQSNQLEILQPDFLATKAEAFERPTRDLSAEEPVGASEEELEIAKRMDRLNRFREDLADLDDRLTEAGGPVEDEVRDRDRDRGGRDRGGSGGGEAPPGAPGMGGGGFGGPAGGGGGSAGGDDNIPLRRNLMRRINKKQERISVEERWLRARGVEPNPMASEGGPSVPVQPIDLENDQDVLVWAHDITVTPGSVYRYRLAVRVFNPFFSRKIQLAPAQREMAEAPMLTSTFSDWTDEVQVMLHREFFVVDAAPEQGGIGMGTATIEVYRFYDGQWRMEKFRVQPGDRIGEAMTKDDEPIDFSTSWYVLDILESLDAGAGSPGDRPAAIVVRNLDDGRLEQIRITSADRRDPNRNRLKAAHELMKSRASRE